MDDIRNPIQVPSCAAPCISGATGNITIDPRVTARSATSSGELTGVPTGSAPPMPAKKMSSWRHITPFGMPVVPPV